MTDKLRGRFHAYPGTTAPPRTGAPSRRRGRRPALKPNTPANRIVSRVKSGGGVRQPNAGAARGVIRQAVSGYNPTDASDRFREAIRRRLQRGPTSSYRKS